MPVPHYFDQMLALALIVLNLRVLLSQCQFLPLITRLPNQFYNLLKVVVIDSKLLFHI